MARRSPAEKAAAVVLAEQDSNRAAAKAFGVSDSTIREWRKEAQSRETAHIKKGDALDPDQLDDLRQALRSKMEEGLHELFDRLLLVARDSSSLDLLSKAFGIVFDKAALAAGKPTSIAGAAVPDGTPEELEAAAEELRTRREEVPA